METGIKHRYIRSYRLQTNGKIERFLKTIEEDLLAGTYFQSMEHLQEELTEYLYYYNHHRPPIKGLVGVIPLILTKTVRELPDIYRNDLNDEKGRPSPSVSM